MRMNVPMHYAALIGTHGIDVALDPHARIVHTARAFARACFAPLGVHQ